VNLLDAIDPGNDLDVAVDCLVDEVELIGRLPNLGACAGDGERPA
jgi:hypothetical protein